MVLPLISLLKSSKCYNLRKILKIDTIIIDPPRPGIAKKNLKKIIKLNSDKIIYVSCNPSTQARDIKILIKNGYRIEKFSIADQFPHTHHIETIFMLIKSIDNIPYSNVTKNKPNQE